MFISNIDDPLCIYYLNIYSRAREFSRDNLGLRDGSEMIVTDVCVKGTYKLIENFVNHLNNQMNRMFVGEKKRHHHHHHKPANRESHLVASNTRRDHRNGHY